MAGIERHQSLIQALAADLKPVRPALPPLLMTTIFAAGAVLVGGAVTMLTRFPHLVTGPARGWAVWLPVLAAALTALCGVFAAFQTGLPDRSRLWALLPVPAAALWLAAEIYHCLSIGSGVPLWGGDLAESLKCVRCILLASAPLAALAVAMLRGLNPLQPGLASLLAGVAAASAGAAILAVSHPHDPAALDFALHGAAVAAVVLLTLALGRRALES